MSRLQICTRDEAPAASKPVLDTIYRKMGIVPNYARLLGRNPTVLQAFTAFQDGLSNVLNPKTRERIALAISQVNACEYCLSAHTYLATNFAKLPPEEITLNRQGQSKDEKANAAVEFSVSVAEKRGQVTDTDLNAVKAAGYAEPQIIEIIGLVAETTFLNYLNKVADTNIDFPAVTQMPALTTASEGRF